MLSGEPLFDLIMSEKTSLKRLQVFNFKLNALLEITQAINANLSVSELLARYQHILQENLNIGRVIIFKNSDTWECILNTSAPERLFDDIDVEQDLSQFIDIRFISNSGNTKLKDFDFVIPVYNNNNPLAYILIGDIDEEMAGVSPVIKHLHFIQTISNIIIVAIENIRLFRESLKQEALKKELELASRMQNMLIPKQSVLPKNDRILVAAYYKPHFEIGGDYYDFIPMGDNEFGFCIADVSGKGMSAALLMSNFQASLRALFTREIPLNILVERLNELVMSNANCEKFITMFVGRYDFKSHELEYINAGHNPPLLYEVDADSLSMLKSGCVGLGMLDFIPYIIKGHCYISGNTKLLCYTDGLVELVEGDKISMATQLLEEQISNANTIGDNISRIKQILMIEEGNTAIFDDITMLGIQFF
jgi:sigma-B regulation protein RsbU (phosphoserine phosphatase)